MDKNLAGKWEIKLLPHLVIEEKLIRVSPTITSKQHMFCMHRNVCEGYLLWDIVH